jgi:hypothetical protein
MSRLAILGLRSQAHLSLSNIDIRFIDGTNNQL